MTLFAVFLLAYVLSQFFRAFLAVIAPRLTADLALGPADLANMSAAFYFVFAVVQFPLGVALDRLGPRRTVPALMLAGVAGACLLSQAHGATVCIAAMALMGLVARRSTWGRSTIMVVRKVRCGSGSCLR